MFRERLLRSTNGEAPKNHDYLDDKKGPKMTRTLAYLDPGSAGVLLQMIGGGVVALALTIKLFGRRILRLFRSRTDDPKADAVSRPDTR